MKAILLILMALMVAPAALAVSAKGNAGNGHSKSGADSHGSNFGHCRLPMAECVKAK